MPRKTSSLLFRGKASDFGSWSRELVHHKELVNHQIILVSSGVLAAGQYDFRFIPDHKLALEASVATGKRLVLTGVNSAIATFNGVLKGVHLKEVDTLTGGETISAVLSSYANNDKHADSVHSTRPVPNTRQYVSSLIIDAKTSSIGSISAVKGHHSDMLYHQVTLTSNTSMAAGKYNVRLIPDVDDTLEASVDIGKELDISGEDSAVVQFTGVLKGVHLEVSQAFTAGAIISAVLSSSTERFDSIVAEDISASPGVHSHVEADITDLDKYTQAQVDTKVGVVQTDLDNHKIDPNTHTNLTIDGGTF